jgi:para-nitrobenzyl esterase
MTPAGVPFIAGANGDEGTLFPRPELFGGVAVASDAEYQAALERAFGTTKAALVLAEYPSSAFPTPNDAIIEVTGDAFFVCPARRFARQVVVAGGTVYLYSFEHAPAQPLIAGLGAFHSAELPFVFGNDSGLAVTQASEKPLVDLVQGYWTRFAKTSDPNGGAAATWPQFTESGDQSLALDLPASTTVTGLKKAKCDFWDGLQ